MARRDAASLEGGLQRERVDDRAEHRHVVSGRALYPELVRNLGAPEDVAAADYYRELGPGLDCLEDLRGGRAEAPRVYPVAVLPGEALSREL